jgi:hypothetical protein
VADWLSIWNKTRKRREAELQGDVIDEIYVPYGDNRVSVGDKIYCVGMEGGELFLIIRVEIAKLSPDPDAEHGESVLVDGAKSNTAKADYKRRVPTPTVKKLKYRLRDDTEQGVKLKPEGGGVEPGQFQGISSLRELTEGSAKLDALL